MMERMRDFILNIFEVYGSKVSQWAWHKRWNRGRYKPHKHYLRGEKK